MNTIFNSSSSESEIDLSERFELKREHKYRKKDLSNPRHVSLGVDSTKSCYLSQSILYNNSDWTAKDVSDSRVLLKYLSDRLYHEVRGKGLTYSISMYMSVSTGRIVRKYSKAILRAKPCGMKHWRNLRKELLFIPGLKRKKQ